MLVWSWQKGKLRIPIESLLRVCCYTKRSAISLLGEGNTVGPSSVELDLCGAVSHLIPKKHRVRRLVDKEKIRQILEEALNENPPVPMSKVIGRLDYTDKSYYKFFPDLCRQISARYAAYQKSVAQQKEQECRQAIREAVLAIHQNGLYPSKQRVLEKLEKPSYINSEAGREMLREMQRELGLG